MSKHIPAAGTDLCAYDALADGTGRAFSWGTGNDAFGVIVVRAAERVDAYVNVCPHFGIPLDHATKLITFGAEFVLCSHHDAAFRFIDGLCVEGPCEGDALTRMPIEIIDGRIRIAAVETNDEIAS